MDSVIVTGSGTGLGRTTSLYLAKRGYRVYATVADQTQADELQTHARSLGVEDLRVLVMDITDKQSIHEQIRTVSEESGTPYGLINNAGIGLRGFFEDLSEQEIRDLFEANVFGTMAVIRAVLPLMREGGRGRIVIITSVGGRIGSLGVSAYCASKFAQEGFGESLFQELLPFGIRVILVEPAITKTERWGIHRGIAKGASRPESPYYAWFQRAEALADRLVQTTPTRPEHIAGTIHKALVAKRPRLRYMVGPRARFVHALRRLTPDSWFERLYFGGIVRRVTRGT